MAYSYLENEKVLALLEPKDIVATATASAYINVENAAGIIEIQMPFGAITSTDAAKGVCVTIEASTAGSSNATEQAIAYKYRQSAAVATDSMGALTDVGSTGVVVDAADDNVTLFAFVNPDALAALGADFNWLRVVLTPTDTDVSVCVTGGIHVRYVSRYAGASIPSST